MLLWGLRRQEGHTSVTSPQRHKYIVIGIAVIPFNHFLPLPLSHVCGLVDILLQFDFYPNDSSSIDAVVL